MKSIYWVRSDLRIRDNVTLLHFCNHSELGVVIWSPTASFFRANLYRREFILSCVSAFKKQLEANGLHLLITKDPFESALTELLDKYQPRQLYFTREFAHEEVIQEEKVIKLCRQRQVEIQSFDQSTLIAQDDLPFELKDMPFVFTDFRKKVEASLQIQKPFPKPTQWPKPLMIESTLFPEVSSSLTFLGGEDNGLKRVQEFIWESHAIKTYKERRNGLLEINDSSKFSPWFSQGCISARSIYHEIKKFEADVAACVSTYWLFFELLWRDYFKFFSRKFGAQIFQLKGVSSAPMPAIEDNPIKYKQWCEAQTDNDFINAHMTELNQTGWMSNRGRQNVASYLVHQYKLPWVWGAQYFETQLLDYDPDLNWGNWLYFSGRGSDPRQRIFNFSRQAEHYDPQGLYQKKWLKKD